MALVTRRELSQLGHIHYITDFILALAYIILKWIPWDAIRIFKTSEYSSVSGLDHMLRYASKDRLI